MKKTFLPKLLVSLLFFAILARLVSGKGFVEILHSLDLFYVGASMLVSAVMVMTSCLKWKWLLQHEGARVSFARLLRFYLIGYYFTNLLPSNMGGDVARSYYAGREIRSQGSAAISVFMERVTGMILLLVLVMAAPAFRFELYRRPAILLPALGAAVLSCIVVWLVIAEAPFQRVVDAYHRLRGSRGRVRPEGEADGVERLLTRIRDRAASLHLRLADSISRLKCDTGLMVRVAALTLLFYALTWVNVYVSFRAFGIALSLFDVAAVLPTAMIVAMLPLTPLAGLGLAEGSYVFFFGLLGVPAAGALAMGLLLRFKLIVLGLLGLGCHLAPGIAPARELETDHVNADG